MTSTNSLLFIFLITNLYGKISSPSESFKTLLNSNGPIDATIHINNIIKNGVNSLTEEQLINLGQLGLTTNNGSIDILNADLDLIYDTEHFRFFYTLEGYDKVESQEYVEEMASIFEEVWSFFIDTMLFDMPPTNIQNLYEIRIENLPGDWFGAAFAIGYGNSCDSYIKMRNSYSASQFSSNTEIDNIKVTAVHEFFHAIQFDYNCNAFEQSPWFMEATAVWSEDELFDSINDHYRYIASWFSKPNTSIILSNQWHEYGSFIFFQYIDEHLGGKETIRNFWENSRQLSNSTEDVTLTAINQELARFNSSFEDVYKRMCIANKILSESERAELYRYEEAAGYRTQVSGPQEEFIIFNEQDTETLYNQSLMLYASNYYAVATDSPVRIKLTTIEGDFALVAILKQLGTNNWTVRFGDDINIDPDLGFEWISLLVSAVGESETFWSYRLQLMDGYSENIESFIPYPNPSRGANILFPIQLMGPQTINLTVFDKIGRTLWADSYVYDKQIFTNLSWNGTNNNGRKVSNGVYFVLVKGKQYQKVHKVTYLKKE